VRHEGALRRIPHDRVVVLIGQVVEGRGRTVVSHESANEGTRGTFARVISPRGVRRIVIGVCALAIVGMIVSSITTHNGIAIATGLVAAVAIVCLILVTAVAGPEAFGAPPPVDEAAAADLERRVESLVASGASEDEVRSLIRATRRLSRRQ
jgi:hypothetical protein